MVQNLWNPARNQHKSERLSKICTPIPLLWKTQQNSPPSRKTCEIIISIIMFFTSPTTREKGYLHKPPTRPKAKTPTLQAPHKNSPTPISSPQESHKSRSPQCKMKITVWFQGGWERPPTMKTVPSWVNWKWRSVNLISWLSTDRKFWI